MRGSKLYSPFNYMKYCATYIKNKNEQLIKTIDEININYRPQDSTLVEFMLAYPNQRINITISDPDDFITNHRINFFEAIAKEHEELNFALKIEHAADNYHDIEAQTLHHVIAGTALHYFFSTYCSDIETFWSIISLEPAPSDIYITESLGFNIKTCAELAHDRGIQVRVFPNVAQSAWKEAPGIEKFFIRPEDVPVYEPYVDVMEFYGDPEKANIYYKIYARDKKWFGNLNEIIIDLNQDIDSRCLLPDFAVARLDCGKRCLKGHPCHICKAQQTLAELLHKHDLTVKELSS